MMFEMQVLGKWILLTCFFFYLECVSRVASRGDGGVQQNTWPQGNPQQGRNQGGSHTKGGGAPLGGWDDEVRNPWGGFPEDTSGWKLEDSIPGMPGKSYPNLDKIPETSFDCRRQKGPGYYGDIESQCQVFHICQAGGRQNSFLCPVGTIFNQETFVCDWWFNVNCADTESHYERNSNLHRGSDIGIDGSKINRVPSASGNSKGSEQLPPVGIPTWDQGESASWGMKGAVNQNRQQGPQQTPGLPPNSQKGIGIQRNLGGGSGGHNRQDKGSPRLGNGRGMNTWPRGGGQNQGLNQKSPRGGMNQKGQGQAGRTHQRRGLMMGMKGMAQPQGIHNSQKGDPSGGNRNFKRRMGPAQGNKDYRRQAVGQVMPVNFGNRNQRMKGSSGQSNANKGHNVNGWSMGPQNLQNQREPKENSWGNGPIENASPNLPMNNPWSGDVSNIGMNVQNNAHSKGESGNSNWNENHMNNQWNNNFQTGEMPNQQNSFGNVNNFRENNNFNYDYSYNENWWAHKNKEVNEYQKNDYDYNYQS